MKDGIFSQIAQKAIPINLLVTFVKMSLPSHLKWPKVSVFKFSENYKQAERLKSRKRRPEVDRLDGR